MQLLNTRQFYSNLREMILRTQKSYHFIKDDYLKQASFIIWVLDCIHKVNSLEPFYSDVPPI